MQVVFEASKRKSFRGDISIDDVTLRDGPCDPPITTASPGAVTLAPNRVTFPKCSFQTGLCGFTQLKTDKFDWTRKKGATSSKSTGPSKDHTTGSAAGNL